MPRPNLRSLSTPIVTLIGSFAILTALAVITPSRGLQNPAQIKPDDAEFFETKVRPILANNCFSCHGEKLQQSGLRLDSQIAIVKGSAAGAVVVPGVPERSRLILAIYYTGPTKMPPAGKLARADIDALTKWIKMGAPWPEAPVAPMPAITVNSTSGIHRPSNNWWSFRPVVRPALPAVKNRAWCSNPIDYFVLSQIEKYSLHPAPKADKRTLIRRATFDLTGLPPTVDEVNAFLVDNSSNAYAKVVDRLLASPAYGVRWARHWLDVVRYCDSLDSRGVGSEGDVAFAYKYRDWVVDAFNRDMPYSDFIRYQIAGDLLPPGEQSGKGGEGESGRTLSTAPSRSGGASVSFQPLDTHHSPLTTHRSTPGDGQDINIPGIIATGMLAIGNWGNGDADKEKILTDIADDQVDVVSRAFMGLTMACARCHDHKFDPLTTKDYYGLAGIFFSTHILAKLTPKGAGENPLRIPLETKADVARREQYKTRLAELESLVNSTSSRYYREHARTLLPKTADYLMAVWDFKNRSQSEARLTLADFAAKSGVQEYALRQWQEFLGFGEYRLLPTTAKDYAGNPGLYAWTSPTPAVALWVNTTDKAYQVSTLTLPAKSVSVHPGPNSGVAVSWDSPISGRVKITGRAVDGDPNCGNGIAWVIEKRFAGGTQQIASGEFPNGGSQDFGQGAGAVRLNEVEVKRGDRMYLMILPNGEYSCDTTRIDFNLKQLDGQGAWDLASDLIPDPLSGNPHPDLQGNPAVWRFVDMVNSGAASTPDAGLKPVLDRWKQAASGRDRDRVASVSSEFQNAFMLDSDKSPFWIQNSADETTLPLEGRSAIQAARTRLDEHRKNAPPPIEYANGAQDGGVPESTHAGIHDVKVHIRGSYLRLGDLVPRRFPVVLAGEKQPPFTKDSGRVELANWLANPKHPLTGRVIVNRIWRHHFGEGIVRTPSNFGFLGERPTHPELLDWLASEFVSPSVEVWKYGGKTGPPADFHTSTPPNLHTWPWSLKRLHRLIMLSSTYQQSNEAPAVTVKADPDNRLFSRMNRRRLEAEAVRDNLLAVAGKLDPKMGGVGERDFNVPRRTLYLMTIRSDRTGFGSLFDMADSTNSVDRRTVSTVAPQALFMMNHPFIIAQTKALAQRLLDDLEADDRSRIQKAYNILYARNASPAEVQIGLAYLSRARSAGVVQASTTPASSEHQSWERYCQILLCANEFIYID